MPSFLDQMAAQLYEGFRGKLHSGAIRRMAGGSALDAKGRPIGQAPVLIPCEGFEDDYSALTRAQAGIPLTSVRVNIFGASIGDGLPPRMDELVRLDPPSGPRWYKLKERIATDPAGALWQCEAQRAIPPAP